MAMKTGHRKHVLHGINTQGREAGRAHPQTVHLHWQAEASPTRVGRI